MAIKPPTPRRLDSQIARTNQDVTYLEHVRLTDRSDTDHTCRIEIRSNVYKNQCSAQLKRWSGIRWEGLAFIPSSLMKTPDSLAYCRPENDALAFEEDRDELVRQALLVLG